MSLGTQEEMPETEAIAEPDTGDSHSGGTISDVDEESDSDIDSRPSEAPKAKRIARQLRQLGDYNEGPASVNVTEIYPSTLDYAYIIGHPLLDILNACKVSSAPRNHREAMTSAQAGVASIYRKGARKHVQTRRLRIGFRAEGAQDDWLNVGN